MKLCLLFFAAVSMLPAQSVVEGEVVNSLTGEPIPGVRIAPRMSGNVVISDAAGHFRLPMADPQTILVFNRPGYLTRNNVWFHTGATSGVARFQLTPQSVIAGTIEDEDGFPVEGGHVSAYQYRYSYGRRQLQPFGHSAPLNERGEYRLSDLPAGSFYLRVTPGHAAEWDPRYASQFYPDGNDPTRAELVEVAAGQERGGVDFRLTPKEGVTVSGRFNLPKGSQPNLVLQPADESLRGGMAVMLRGSATNGRFTFSHVPPGNYVLTVPEPGIGGRKEGDLYVWQQIEVGTTDLRDLVLDVHAIEPIDLPGKVVFADGVAPHPVTVWADFYAARRISATSGSDGSFVLKGLLPSEYGLWTDSPSPSIRLGDREVSHSGFEYTAGSLAPLQVTIPNSVQSTVNGKVVDSSGRAIAGALLILRSVRSETWLLATSDGDGAFSLRPVPVGDYHVYLPSEEWNAAYFDDPGYRETHASDFPMVHVVPGENAPVTLRTPVK